VHNKTHKKKKKPFAKGKAPMFAKGKAPQFGSPQQQLAGAMQSKGYSGKSKVPPQFAKKG